MGDLNKPNPKIKSGKGIYLITEDNRKILDASSGAAVSCIGHGDKRVIKVINIQHKTGASYVCSTFWTNIVTDELCEYIIISTNGKMIRVFLINSGSEGIETAIKLARYYYFEKNKNSKRINIIAREGSYHGNTFGALSVSGHFYRREPYTPLLLKNVHFISSCYPYRQRKENETDAQFLLRKKIELEEKILELGPETVMAFIMEPVVGAALGCVTPVPGYLKAVREVCDKYDIILIFDEVMCGSGRTGYLHAWQAENVAPDIQIMAKGLAGGYAPISAVLASEKVVNTIAKGSGEFVHGHTYEGMPTTTVAALEKLLKNVSKQGTYLKKRLEVALKNHPNVGDIRGQGLFLGIELVENKITKKPFDPKLSVSQKIVDLALSPEFNMTIYRGANYVEGVRIEFIMLAPPL